MNKYDDLAEIIIRNVGGSANISSLTHCATRLRLRLRDETRIKIGVLNNTPGVVTVIHSGGQYMIVLGQHVTDVYDAVCAAMASGGRPTAFHPLRKVLSLFPRDFPHGAEPDEETGTVLYAPAAGKVHPLSKIEDPVFSSEALGKGCAIDPIRGEVVAPFDGVVLKIAETKHAISLRSPDGVEVLIHVGMDTVELKGLGFLPQVQEGSAVTRGQLLLKFNRTAIAAAGYCLTIPVVVTNSEKFSEIRTISGGTVSEGEKLLLVR